jgi:putative membrane protein
MNSFATAAALTVLAATTVAFSAPTQEQPSAQSPSVPNPAPTGCQHEQSAALARESNVGAKLDIAPCQVKREAMKNSAASTAFASTAAQDGMVEVALATLALRKSGDNRLRQFAEKVFQDYAKSNDGLDAIVKCEGLILPMELDPKRTALVKKLDAKSGMAFEKAYLKHIAEEHAEAVAVFKSASISADPDLAAFAREGLSMLQEHKLLADNLREIDTRLATTH